jgi:hypothetical protein
MGIKGQSRRSDQTPRLRLPRTGADGFRGGSSAGVPAGAGGTFRGGSGVVATGTSGEEFDGVATGVVTGVFIGPDAAVMGGTVGMPDSAPGRGVMDSVDATGFDVPSAALSGAGVDPLSPPPPHAANPATRIAVP